MYLSLRTAARAVALAFGLSIACGANAMGSDDDHRFGGYRHSPHRGGVVFTMTNAADGNSILMYPRSAHGDLGQPVTVPTGGRGTGAGLGNQGGVILSNDGHWLLAVNAGSNQISVFKVGERSLTRTDLVASGGEMPVSVTVADDLVYVVNRQSDAIAGFHLTERGHLLPLSGSVQPLSAKGANPAQIGFSPDGRQLVVTERNTNRVVTYPVGGDGAVSASPSITPSPAPTPFGFDFAGFRQLLVSEAAGGAANASSVSSYRLGRDGALTTLAPAVGTLQSAACWVEVSPNGRYAYTTNTGSDSLTGYRLAANGGLTRLDASGVTASTGDNSRPIDLGFSRDGRFVYTLNSGDRSISVLKAIRNGGLRPIAKVSGLPVGANGMAVR